MRYLLTISFSLILFSCTKGIHDVARASEKISNTVTNCTEAAMNIRSEIQQIKLPADFKNPEEYNSASFTWDAHGMLW